MEIYSDENILIEEENKSVFLTVPKTGCKIKDFEKIIGLFPRITITKFTNLKDALELGENKRVQIGELRPIINLNISPDKMSANIRLNCTIEDFINNRESFIKKILDILYQSGISEGILSTVIHEQLDVQKDILVASGIQPIDGDHAKIKYYQFADRKPTIKSDGKADFYDMNFIDEVKIGDWLGEKILPTDGTPGRTITGEIIPPKKGKNINLLYDRKTVEELEEDGKVVLRALVDGVVEINGCKISVGKHLLINEDVGVATGNIDFNGSITITGIVQDGYSVVATKDIAIQGEMGISGVEKIISYHGDVFIKGGVFGKGDSLIKAGKNIFVKHANECLIEAGESIHIGIYSIGSTLKANNIFTHPTKGKIIGGMIEAKGRVIAGTIGNHFERKTIIQVEGINRGKILNEIKEIVKKYEEHAILIEKLKSQIVILEKNIDLLNEQQLENLNEFKNHIDQYLLDISIYEERKKSLEYLLETKGDGQVSIVQVAFPETFVQIKHSKKRLDSSVKGTFYSLQNNLLFE
ncbi:DUF342 domain-containing protein [Bacillus sp. CGMCC 1.16607]|uniref:DUF342 domain-containing protein n=1 Tax=Bacillus sp. CGMCC 1.16607 TaxID=3351842 RepID=UPI0036459D25